jgi:hypothetical protein
MNISEMIARIKEKLIKEENQDVFKIQKLKDLTRDLREYIHELYYDRDYRGVT